MLLVRTYLILLLLLVSASAVRPFLRSIWTAWKMVHNKTYSMPQEEHLRMRIFANNYMFVRWHNERYYLGLETYSTGLNAFADLTLKEFVDQYLTLQPKQSDFWEDTTTEVLEDCYFAPAPKYIDWRKKGLVTPVKDQGPCGSCWAFSATGALEGQLKKKRGKLTALSEQQLVDCSKVAGNNGCNGGLMDNAFRYWMRKGAESERDYPYTARDGACKFNENKTIVKVKMFRRVVEKNEEQLRLSVAQVGPISVAIDASSFGFQFYKSGIYEDTECSQTNLDHGVLVVGYDEDKKRRKYWIVKNSWGERWGQEGYIWMAREKNNMCGIATMASYPLV